MKNYMYHYQIKERFVEVPESDYTSRMWNNKEYIDVLSDAVVLANCGWDKVAYKVMRYKEMTECREFMVLCVRTDVDKWDLARWIPIDGNSKGCNFSVLGENLW